MKLLLVLLFATCCLYGIGQAPHIDSLVPLIEPLSPGGQHVQVMLKVYVAAPDSAGQVLLKLGTTNGGSDIMDATYMISNLILSTETGGATYYLVDAGKYHGIPPFASVYLVDAVGNITTVNKQLAN